MSTVIHKGLEKSASRLEALIRIPYLFVVSIVCFIYGIVIGVWGVAIGIIRCIHWFYILITGKRWKFANKYTVNFLNYTYGRFFIDYLYKKVVPYTMLLTDKRPGFSI